MYEPIQYCLLCGERLKFYFKHDCDHMGPMDSGHWEQREHKCKSSLKKMCLNCKFYESGCTNKEVKRDILDKIKTISKPFIVTFIDLRISIPDYRESCSYWELSETISRRLFK